jgi:hypothetical protein
VTPAGRFLCWRIRNINPGRALPAYRPETPDPGIYFWVSRERGWLVQSLFASPGKEPYRQVLISASEE